MKMFNGHICGIRLKWHWPLSGQMWAAHWDVSMHSCWMFSYQPQDILSLRVSCVPVS